MIALQSDVRVYLSCGYTDMRKGMQGLAMLVQQVLAEDPFNGALYAFRGRRGNLLKLIWHDGIGLCMLTKRLERGHFIWPMTSMGSIALSAGQLSTLLEGCEWRATARNLRAQLAGWCKGEGVPAGVIGPAARKGVIQIAVGRTDSGLWPT